MKNVTDKDENIKAWETFIQSLTVETLLDSYMCTASYPDHTIVSSIDDVVELVTFGDHMAILHGVVWYLFSIPLALWDKTIDMGVDKELLHMLDSKIVRDFIRMIEL